jgi:hypothetical protein
MQLKSITLIFFVNVNRYIYNLLRAADRYAYTGCGSTACSVGTVYGGKGDLYTPDARPALLATPCLASLATPCSRAQADPVWRIATETWPVRNTISGFPSFMNQGLSILGDMRAISIYASFLAGPWMIGSNSRPGSSSRSLHSSEWSVDAN